MNLVIAPSFQMAKMIARGKGWDIREWRYVTNAQDMHGRMPPETKVYVYSGSRGHRWSIGQLDAYHYWVSGRGWETIGVLEAELVP